MAKRHTYVVSCHFDEKGITLQEMVEKYFVIYFKEKLEKLGNLNES